MIAHAPEAERHPALSFLAAAWSWLFLLILLVFFETWARAAYGVSFLLNPFNVQSIALFAAMPLLLGLGQTFVIIDPPFERGDDYDRVVETCRALTAKEPGAVVLVWLPLKDLETFDRFLRGLEEAEVGKALTVECRLRPLDNPMAMNGCALVVINPPASVREPLEDANRWIVVHCGGATGHVQIAHVPGSLQ